MKIMLTLYHTEHCHLCEMAEELCLTLLNPEYFTLTLVDIAEDETLLELYGVRIPVLKVENDGREIGWPFDGERLMEFLSNTQPF